MIIIARIHSIPNDSTKVFTTVYTRRTDLANFLTTYNTQTCNPDS